MNGAVPPKLAEKQQGIECPLTAVQHQTSSRSHRLPPPMPAAASSASASNPATAAAAGGSGGGGGGSGASSPRRPRSRPDSFLILCRFFGVFTAVAALLCVAANVLSAVRSFRHGSDIFGGIFRCYAVALALFVAVAETEWGFIMKFGKVLEYWVGRGMLQIFVAVMTRAFPDIYMERKDLVLLQELSSYLLMCCGLIYVISGVLCIGFLKRARQEKAISREQAAKDLLELERRRDELEALLVAERV